MTFSRLILIVDTKISAFNPDLNIGTRPNGQRANKTVCSGRLTVVDSTNIVAAN